MKTMITTLVLLSLATSCGRTRLDCSKVDRNEMGSFVSRCIQHTTFSTPRDCTMAAEKIFCEEVR